MTKRPFVLKPQDKDAIASLMTSSDFRSVVVWPADSSAVHDLKQALRRFQVLSDLLADGYDFSTEQGMRMLVQLKESMATLEALLQVDQL